MVIAALTAAKKNNLHCEQRKGGTSEKAALIISYTYSVGSECIELFEAAHGLLFSSAEREQSSYCNWVGVQTEESRGWAVRRPFSLPL